MGRAAEPWVGGFAPCSYHLMTMPFAIVFLSGINKAIPCLKSFKAITASGFLSSYPKFASRARTFRLLFAIPQAVSLVPIVHD